MSKSQMIRLYQYKIYFKFRIYDIIITCILETFKMSQTFHFNNEKALLVSYKTWTHIELRVNKFFPSKYWRFITWRVSTTPDISCFVLVLHKLSSRSQSKPVFISNRSLHFSRKELISSAWIEFPFESL